jgi:hypothetical protein
VPVFGELGHLLWIDLAPKGYKEVSRAWLFAAREFVGTAVLSHGLLYVAQNTRDANRRRPDYRELGGSAAREETARQGCDCGRSHAAPAPSAE